MVAWFVFSFGKMALTPKTLIFENSSPFQKEAITTPEVAHNKETPATTEEKIAEYFPADAQVAVAIAKAESSLNPSAPSITDKMADGRSFSFGLFQINLTVSVIDGVDCSKAFSGRDYNAVVVDEELFAQCIELATDTDKNLAVAKQKFEKRNWQPWGAFTSGSYKKYL